MLSSHVEGEEIFFDSLDYVRTSVSSASSYESVTENPELESGNSGYEIWTNELRSICERRDNFFRGMGFNDFVSSKDVSSKKIVEEGCRKLLVNCLSERSTERSSAAVNFMCMSVDRGDEESDFCIRALDSGKVLGQDGSLSSLKEGGSERLLTVEEHETSSSHFPYSQLLMRSEDAPFGEKYGGCPDKSKRKSKGWWRRFLEKSLPGGMCRRDVSVKNNQVPKTMRTRVQHHSKRYKEFTAVYMGQEIQAHKGSIRTMKFSRDGRFLATGGEDSVVRIWGVMEVDAYCNCISIDGSSNFADKVEADNLVLGRKYRNLAPVFIPKKIFKIKETPVQEFHGHSSDILDLSWSKSDVLLTSSKDKTVRMWQVGCDGCLKVFQHSNYVTCIQFNPVDDGYFISGSIDGKVRIWGISESRVIDWVDVRDIITAVCYRPDGQGFVVGFIAGNCRFYDSSGNTLQLDTQLSVQGRKKSIGKRITGFQFTPEDTQKVMITSADSSVRIFNGVDVIHKYKGLRKSKSQLSASFTPDGRHIVSVGADSRVYIWNYNGTGVPSPAGSKSIRSYEHFSSEDASVAIAWPGMDYKLDSPQLQKCIELPTRLRDPDCFSFGSWLFADGACSRGAATWPEENLPPSSMQGERVKHQSLQDSLHKHQCHEHQQLTSLLATWSRVIVTAGRDGAIRSFHNYGLPVRL